MTLTRQLSTSPFTPVYCLYIIRCLSFPTACFATRPVGQCIPGFPILMSYKVMYTSFSTQFYDCCPRTFWSRCACRGFVAAVVSQGVVLDC